MTLPVSNKTEIKELMERVRAATGPDRDLDFLIQIHVAHPLTGEEHYTLQDVMNDFALLGADGMVIDAPYTASIDAALALVERVLPGRWNEILGAALRGMSKTFHWHIAFPKPGQMDGLPLAILACLLQALQEKGK